MVFPKSKEESTLPTFITTPSSSAKPPLHEIVLDIANTSIPSTPKSPTNSITSNHHFASPIAKLAMVHSRFTWYEMLLVMSFSVPVGLLSVTYEEVGDYLVPAKLFTSHPHLFFVFIIFDSLAFTASAIGFWLHNMHPRISKHLAVFAIASFMLALAVFLWVLLPTYLKWFSYIFFFVTSLPAIYVQFSNEGNEHNYLDDSIHRLRSLVKRMWKSLIGDHVR